MEESKIIKNQSEDIKELAIALCKAQSQMSFASRDSENGYYKSKYADLYSVWEACREPLNKNGLCVVQQVNGLSECGGIVLNTLLVHTSGQWIKSVVVMTPSDNKPQTYGLCLSYARRYGLSSLVGVVQDDDDGNCASGIGNKNIQKVNNYKDSKPFREHHRSGGVEKNEISNNKKSEYLEKMKNVNSLEELKTVWSDSIPKEYRSYLSSEKDKIKLKFNENNSNE